LQNNIISGLFVGQNLIILKEVDSTNNFLKNTLSNSKPLPEGTVIMAESQYAGRGQQQNRWHSDDGKNALFPLLGKNLKIKWPNDIYYNNMKLGGMLIENSIQGSQIKHAIIGIGLNINQDSFPESVPNAASIKQILQRDYDLRQILSDLCRHIEAWYLKLKAGQVNIVRKEYLSRLYWLGENKRFRSATGDFEGIVKDVLNNGLLVVKNSFETELSFNFKEIEFLNK